MAKDICIVTGSRSDWGLLEPLLKELENTPRQYFSLIDLWGIPNLDWGQQIEVLPNSDTSEGTCTAMGLIYQKLPYILRQRRPDVVTVLGDRYEILSVATVCYTMGIPIAHIEGSDTTLGSLDEGYRKAIRAMASIHFDVEEYGSLGCVIPPLRTDIPNVTFIFCYHPWNGPWKEEFKALLDIYEYLPGGIYITTNNDAGGRWINEQYGARGIEPRSYDRQTYLSLLAKAKFIVGNSSSGLIEAPQVNTVTFNVGDRQKVDYEDLLCLRVILIDWYLQWILLILIIDLIPSKELWTD